MLKNKNYYKIQIGLIMCIFIMCVLKIVAIPGGIFDVIDGSLLEDENYEYKNLGLNPEVRVLLMSEGYKEEYHKEISLTGNDMIVRYGKDHECENSLEDLYLTSDHEYFKWGSIKISNGETEKLTINSYERAYGNPNYDGILEIYATDEGLVMINELPLETYLKAVVPSESPSSFEMEALKAQAVCARSYAYNQMQTISYLEYDAHMNDSVAYQVYNNSKEVDKTNQAILATTGEKLGFEDKVVTTYFFSTSSGHTTDVRAWGTSLNDTNAYLKGVEISGAEGHYERNLPWYKWKVEIENGILEAILELNLSENIGKLTNVEIIKKGAGDVVLELRITGSGGVVNVEGENAIRKALGSDQYSIVKNDDTIAKGMELLPSAFFNLEKDDDKYIITGGGLGHGIGMSQNGANQMAKAGMDYLEILNTFYQNTEIIL